MPDTHVACATYSVTNLCRCLPHTHVSYKTQLFGKKIHNYAACVAFRQYTHITCVTHCVTRAACVTECITNLPRLSYTHAARLIHCITNLSRSFEAETDVSEKPLLLFLFLAGQPDLAVQKHASLLLEGPLRLQHKYYGTRVHKPPLSAHTTYLLRHLVS